MPAGAPAPPPVESGPGDPQGGDHLIDGQQVIGIAGHAWSLLPRSRPWRCGRCVSVPAACPCGVVHARSGLAGWSSPRDDTPPAVHAWPAGRRPACGPVRRCVRPRGPARQHQRGRAGPGPCGRTVPASGPRVWPRPGAGAGHAACPATRAAPRGRPVMPAKRDLTSRAELGVDRRRCMSGRAAASRGLPLPGRYHHHPTLEVHDRDYCPCKPGTRPGRTGTGHARRPRRSRPSRERGARFPR
jgi:hypothetical protein